MKYWKTKENIEIISNFLTFKTKEVAKLKNKKIISVGRYDNKKGYYYLIDAQSLVEEKISDWKLEIYEEGELKEEYQSQIKKLE